MLPVTDVVVSIERMSATPASDIATITINATKSATPRWCRGPTLRRGMRHVHGQVALWMFHTALRSGTTIS